MAESKTNSTNISEKEHHHTAHHHQETHGTSDDIDENTPIDEVKGPGFFERAKEEIEAIVGAILPMKDKSQTSHLPLKDLVES